MRVIDSEDADAARAAAAAVREGSLVVLPTDTVYGVGADPRSPRAVDRLLTAKGRGRDKSSSPLRPRPRVWRGRPPTLRKLSWTSSGPAR